MPVCIRRHTGAGFSCGQGFVIACKRTREDLEHGIRFRDIDRVVCDLVDLDRSLRGFVDNVSIVDVQVGDLTSCIDTDSKCPGLRIENGSYRGNRLPHGVGAVP